MLHDHLLSAILLVPIAGALVVAAAPRAAAGAGVVRRIPAVSAGVTLLMCVALWRGYDPAGLTWQFTERVRVLPSIGASYAVGVDGFAIALLTLAAVAPLLAIVAAPAPGAGGARVQAWLLVLQGAVCAVFVALDLLLLVCAWTAALAALYRLLRIAAAPNHPSPRPFVIHAAISAAALAAGVLGLWLHVHGAAATYTFDLAQVLQLAIPADAQRRLFVPFSVAFAVLVPLVPFVAWLAPVHAGLPPAARIAVSALVLKLGTYGLARIVLPVFPDATREFAMTVTVLAAITVACAAVAAFRAAAPARALAWLSGAYVAIVVLTMFRLTPGTLEAAMLQHMDHGALMAAAYLVGARVDAAAPGAPWRQTLYVAAAIAALTAWSFAPIGRGPLGLALIETSAGRVIARVDPAYAPVVRQPSDCGAPASSAPPSSSAPAGWVTAAPCEDPGAGPGPSGRK